MSLYACDVDGVQVALNTHNSCTQPLVTMAASEVDVFAVSTTMGCLRACSGDERFLEEQH